MRSKGALGRPLINAGIENAVRRCIAVEACLGTPVGVADRHCGPLGPGLEAEPVAGESIMPGLGIKVPPGEASDRLVSCVVYMSSSGGGVADLLGARLPSLSSTFAVLSVFGFLVDRLWARIGGGSGAIGLPLMKVLSE